MPVIDGIDFDHSKVQVQAERQHEPNCKAMDRVMDRYYTFADNGYTVSDEDKLPALYLDWGRARMHDGARKRRFLDIYCECLDCGMSGHVDILDKEELHVKQRTKPSVPSDDRGNNMGGSDVSHKYRSS